MRLNLFLYVYSYSVHPQVSWPTYIVHSSEPGGRPDLGLFVPSAAGLHGHDAQRRQRNLHLQLRESLVSKAADPRCDAAPHSAARLPRAPRVDDDEPIPRLSAYRRAICYCAQRSCACVYVASWPRGAPETMAAGVFRGAQPDADSVRRWLSRGSERCGCSLGRKEHGSSYSRWDSSGSGQSQSS